MAVAVSGGPDSMALLSVMRNYAQDRNIKLHVLSVDHGLRAEAKEEVAQVAQWAQTHNSDYIFHSILTWEGDKPNSALMENARKARYGLMAKYCKRNHIQLLFLGHHQDDQAETFLIRLAKGSGLDGLSAMQDLQQYDDDVVLARPFLSVSKVDLVSHCEGNNIPFVQDPSNQNDNFLRPRLRASMDVLSAEGLTPKRLSLTAKRLSRARQALDEIAGNAYQASLVSESKGRKDFDYNALKSCPVEIAFRVIACALEGIRPAAEYQVRMEKLEDLIDDLLTHETFKARTLGGCKFSLNTKGKTIVTIEQEKQS